MSDPISGTIGAIVGAGVDLYNAKKNRDMQEEFAQNGIRWKVADARAAGLHPLAALGAQTTAYQPAYSDSMVDSFRVLGQDISRAVHATRTEQERAEKLADLTVTHSELENDLLRAQISKLNAPHSGPGLPAIGDSSDGQNPRVQVNPAQQTVQEPGLKGKDAGAYNSYTYEQLSDGAVAIRPTPEAKNAMDDKMSLSLLWDLNNLYLPESKGGPGKPPRRYWPEGAIDMEWSYVRGAFVPVYKKNPFSGKDVRGVYQSSPSYNPLLKSPNRGSK